jgi:hypothetical protein
VAEDVELSGALRIDPGSLEACEAPLDHAGILEIVVPYADPELTARVVARAATLAEGLNATLKLIAIYVAPYPADLYCPAATREHLTMCLAEAARRTTLAASAHVVVARDRDEGFRRVLRPSSAVLLGTRRRPWRTREERLARELARAGHFVSLLHF